MGTALFSEYVDQWADPFAPGPTSETLFHGEEVVETWEFAYELATDVTPVSL